MDSGGGLFTDAFPLFDRRCEPARAFLCATLQELLDHLFFMTGARRIYPLAAMLHFVAFMKQQRGVAAIVNDELRTKAAGVSQSRKRVVPVFFQRLAL